MGSFRERFTLGVPLAVLVVTVVAVPTMILGPEGLSRHQRLRGQLDAQREENRRLARELLRLRTNVEQFRTDPRARERAVREELGWVRPDEIIVEVPTQPRRGI